MSKHQEGLPPAVSNEDEEDKKLSANVVCLCDMLNFYNTNAIILC